MASPDDCGCFYMNHCNCSACVCCRVDGHSSGRARGSCTLLSNRDSQGFDLRLSSLNILLFSPPRGAGLKAFNGAFLESVRQEPIFSKKKKKSFFCWTDFGLSFCAGTLQLVLRWWSLHSSLGLSWSQGGISEDFLFLKRADLCFSLWWFFITSSAERICLVCLLILRFCLSPSVWSNHSLGFLQLRCCSLLCSVPFVFQCPEFHNSVPVSSLRTRCRDGAPAENCESERSEQGRGRVYQSWGAKRLHEPTLSWSALPHL